MTAFDAILFDLDGTLLNSLELILVSYRHTLAAHDLPARTDAEVLAGLGTPLEASLGRWARRPKDVPALVETYIEHNLRVHDDYVKGYPGVSELVHDLAHSEASLAIVTSKRRRGTEMGLAALGLTDCFDVLVCADDVARAKPDPLPVRQALEALSKPSAHAVFVGDAVHDVEAGNAAGVTTIAVEWGSGRQDVLQASSPTHQVADAAALRALLLG